MLVSIFLCKQYYYNYKRWYKYSTWKYSNLVLRYASYISILGILCISIFRGHLLLYYQNVPRTFIIQKSYFNLAECSSSQVHCKKMNKSNTDWSVSHHHWSSKSNSTPTLIRGCSISRYFPSVHTNSYVKYWREQKKNNIFAKIVINTKQPSN